MLIRWIVIVLIICTSCQSGLIPCPTVRADKVKRSTGKRAYFAPKMVTASVKETKPEPVKRTRPISTTRPALEKVDVEEWDCPKPGTKKAMPKALKDNIRKNKKAFEAYYKNKTDSLSSQN